jgi:acyl-CoA oxidase
MEVGSYALMHDTGFELVDMFLCCKFAEGDSRILQQKLTRDRLKQVRKDGIMGTVMKAINPFNVESTEAVTALMLGQKLQPAGRDREKMGKLMDEHWKDIYELGKNTRSHFEYYSFLLPFFKIVLRYIFSPFFTIFLSGSSE